MTLFEQLKEEYLKELQALVNNYKEASVRLAEEIKKLFVEHFHRLYREV